MTGPGDDDGLSKFIEGLDKEVGQEQEAASAETSYFTGAPTEADIVRRAREYDDPQKQLVRTGHWLRMAKGLREAKGRGLRLLTLPGRHALEIRLYHQHGLLEACQLPSGEAAVGVVGYETSPEVFGMLCSGQPRLMHMFRGDLLEVLGEPSGEPYKELALLFPFDIINLDLTVNLVTPSEGPYGPVPAAIRECFRLQGQQCDDWALMLTFRACLDETNKQTVAQWKDEYQSNLDRHGKVMRACADTYGRYSADELLKWNPEEALGQYAAKWIADQAHTCDWKVVSAKHLRYQRNPEGHSYSIRKLIFRFSKSRLPNWAMPAKGLAPAVDWHEEDLERVVKNCRSRDIDELVARLKPDQLAAITAEIEALVHYDGAAVTAPGAAEAVPSTPAP